MAFRRSVPLVIMAGLFATACLEQYNPYPFWKQLREEREIAHAVHPTLTPDGKLPAVTDAGGGGAEGPFNVGEFFKANCSACHGVDGVGNPALHSRNFTDPEWQSIATDKEIMAVILYGAMNAPQKEASLASRSKFKLQYPTMVPWEALLSKDPQKKEEQLAALVKHIRSFKK